jgi:predicted  nucleic acid-binding Zn-ribbon protein
LKNLSLSSDHDKLSKELADSQEQIRRLKQQLKAAEADLSIAQRRAADAADELERNQLQAAAAATAAARAQEEVGKTIRQLEEDVDRLKKEAIVLQEEGQGLKLQLQQAEVKMNHGVQQAEMVEHESSLQRKANDKLVSDLQHQLSLVSKGSRER